MNYLAPVYKESDTPKLRGSRSMGEDAKAKAYESLRPGVDISTGQKAERFDRMVHRYENGPVNRRRRTKVGSIIVPDLPWMKESK